MDKLVQIIESLQRRINQLERLVKLKNVELPSNGTLVMPSYTTDPASPKEGQIWRNSTSNTIKVYVNGAVRTINTTP